MHSHFTAATSELATICVIIQQMKVAQTMLLDSKHGDAANHERSSLAHLESCLQRAQKCSSTIVRLESRQLCTGLELKMLVNNLKQCHTFACAWSVGDLFSPK